MPYVLKTQAHFLHWMMMTFSQIHFMWSIISVMLFPPSQHPKDGPVGGKGILCC